eukprot:3113377-Rhodomonas_salina.1
MCPPPRPRAPTLPSLILSATHAPTQCPARGTWGRQARKHGVKVGGLVLDGLVVWVCCVAGLVRVWR